MQYDAVCLTYSRVFIFTILKYFHTDFGLELVDCGTGYSVKIVEGSVYFGNEPNPTVTFDKSFRNIIIMMSPCDDTVIVQETFDNSESIGILTGKGDDLIEIGTLNSAFDTEIGAPVVVDAGYGTDKLIIYDDNSAVITKKQEVLPTLVRGIHDNENHTVSYFHVEEMEIYLSQCDVEVRSTAKDSLLTVDCNKESFVNVTTTQVSTRERC